MVQVVLPCSHSICQPCYDGWMKEQANCPLCRSEQNNDDDLWVLTAHKADSLEDQNMARTHTQATKTRILNFMLHLPNIKGRSMYTQLNATVGSPSPSSPIRGASVGQLLADNYFAGEDSGSVTDVEEDEGGQVAGAAVTDGIAPPMLVICPNTICGICFMVPSELVNRVFACPGCRHVARLSLGLSTEVGTNRAVDRAGVVVPHTREEEQAQLEEALSRSVIDTNTADSIIQL
jgi:hypothetical protein